MTDVTFEVVRKVDHMPWETFWLGGTGLKCALNEFDFTQTVDGLYLYPLTNKNHAISLLKKYSQEEMYAGNYFAEAISFCETHSDDFAYFIKVEC